MNNPELLIIDDEPQLRKLLTIVLETGGYNVLQADNGKQGIVLAATHNPKLIILDLGLPDKSGHEVLIELRTWYNNPIIILSVQDNETDIIEALDNGATDYLTKPFRNGELLARIRSCLKRVEPQNNLHSLEFGDILIDYSAQTVRLNNQILKLTTTEFNLLRLLSKNAGKVLTHQFILKEVWGVAYQTETQYLRVFIATLRKKIEKFPTNPQHIITQSGVGYRFE